MVELKTAVTTEMSAKPSDDETLNIVHKDLNCLVIPELAALSKKVCELETKVHTNLNKTTAPTTTPPTAAPTPSTPTTSVI